MTTILKRINILMIGALAAFISAPPHLLMAQQAPSSTRHSLSEICDNCSWEKVVTCRGFLEGINFDRSGQMWMLGYMSGEILRVERDTCVTVGSNGSSPNGAKFHKDGRLFVADRFGGLMSVDTRTGTRTTLVNMFKTEHFRGLNDLVFDANGGIYFTEPYGSNAIDRTGRAFYLPPGQNAKVELFLSGLAYPNGIALSADGQRVYIAEWALNRITSAPVVNPKNPNETPFVFASLEGGIGPDGLAVDNEGNVYAAHFAAGEIVILDSNGFKYGALRLPQGTGSFATNLAFHDGYLYVTEAMKNEVWRVKIKKTGLSLFGDL